MWDGKTELEKAYGKAYINEDLLNMVMKARNEEKALHDESFKSIINVSEDGEELTASEKRYLSQLGRQIESYSKDEIAAVVYTAILNYPEMVFQLLLEEYLNKVNKDRRSEEK